MVRKLTIYLDEDLASKIERASSETHRNQQRVVRDVLYYFVDPWLEAERAKLQAIRQLTQPIQAKRKQ